MANLQLTKMSQLKLQGAEPSDFCLLTYKVISEDMMGQASWLAY